LYAPWRGKQEMFREIWQTDILKQPRDEGYNYNGEKLVQMLFLST